MPSGVYERKPYMKTFGRAKLLLQKIRYWRRRRWSYARIGRKFGFDTKTMWRVDHGYIT